MCGLFGFNGWDKANIAKLKLLGLYNVKRGRDSCGYYFNGKIVKGVGKVKEFGDFIEQNVIDTKSGKSKTFIGHTRWGTVGASTEENAHPFNVEDKLILAHNGTIDNIWTLCNEHKIDSTHIHVDSLALGHLINKEGFSILNEYRGYAALLMHKPSEPDSLYVYHGASKLYEGDPVVYEERPLFYMKTAEGVYFSSLEESLMAIRDNALEIPQKVSHNKVFKLTNGNLAKSFVTIERLDKNIGLEKKTYYGKQNTMAFQAEITKVKEEINGNTNIIINNNTSHTPNPGINNAVAYKALPESKTINILSETMPTKCFSDFSEWDYLYYFLGRYWHVDDNVPADGVVYADKYGVIYDNLGEKIYPYYFHRGVMIKDKHHWDRLQTALADGTVFSKYIKNIEGNNFASTISQYSKYPVCNIGNEASSLTTVRRDIFWLDMKPAAGGWKPLFSDRNYTFKNGMLTEIHSEITGDIMTTTLVNGNKWANSEIFAAKKVIKFDNGEVIIEKKRDDQELLSIDARMEIKPLVKYFKTVYTSLEQIYDDCPSTVFLALRFYLKELFTKTNNHEMKEEDALTEGVNHFLLIVVNDGITFEDNMQDGFQEVEWYLKKAYMAEVASDEPEIYENSDDDALNKRFIEECKKIDDLKKKTVGELKIISAPSAKNTPTTKFTDLDATCNKMLTVITFLDKRVKELSSYEEQFAKEAADASLFSLNVLKDKLYRIAKEHSKTDIVERLKQYNFVAI